MFGIQCPYCQCQITLQDAGTKRLAAALMWFCIGGLAVASVARLLLPAITPPPPDAEAARQIRQSNPDDPAKAEELVAQRQVRDRQDWLDRLSPLERRILDLRTGLGAAIIVFLCVGIPSAILALSIRPEPLQKRPPPTIDH